MEKTNRMDGQSAELAKALLKLIGIIIEGKMATSLMRRIKQFIYNIIEEAKFFQFLSTEHPVLLKEFLDLFEILWGRDVKLLDGELSLNMARSLCDMREEYKWEKIRVNKFGGIQSCDFDNHKTLQNCQSALLVIEGYPYCWMQMDKTINENIALNNFPSCANVEYIITFDMDSEIKTLNLTFFKVGKWE